MFGVWSLLIIMVIYALLIEMDGWMDIQADRPMDGWMDGCIHRCTARWMYRQTDGRWMCKRMDGLLYVWTYLMNGYMYRGTDE